MNINENFTIHYCKTRIHKLKIEKGRQLRRREQRQSIWHEGQSPATASCAPILYNTIFDALAVHKVVSTLDTKLAIKVNKRRKLNSVWVKEYGARFLQIWLVNSYSFYIHNFAKDIYVQITKFLKFKVV